MGHAESECCADAAGTYGQGGRRGLASCCDEGLGRGSGEHRDGWWRGGREALVTGWVRCSGDPSRTLFFFFTDGCREKPLATLSGHSGRVGRVGFHPSGAFLGSAGFDGTWRLWDVATSKELLVQEGHSKEVYALTFQDDGALAASGWVDEVTRTEKWSDEISGFDAIGRVWDLRTGRTAMVLDGHVKEILAMDFAPNGWVTGRFFHSSTCPELTRCRYHVATGSGDDTVRIWDLRALKTQYIIPAHKSSVSDLKFFRSSGEMPHIPLDLSNGVGVAPNGSAHANGASASNGDVDMDSSEGTNPEPSSVNPEPTLPKSGLFLVTAGFDCNVRIWSADEWSLIRNLATDAGKVMSVDVSSDAKFIASASYSRSFHLFGGDHSL